MAMVEERADALAYAATVLGDADALNTVMESYERVTVDDVRRVAAQYLAADRAATLVVVPGEDAEDADDGEEVADAA
jgi:predicted Zn-dependent peptidase